MAETFDYDLFVIGGGSGGVRAARLAAEYGARVALAEEYRVGGTCVIRGCVPKKLLVYASHFSEDFADSTNYGWTPGEATFDWARLIANKDKEIDRLNEAYIVNLKTAGVEVIQSRAELIDAHSIFLVAGERTVSAETVLIATGAAPFVPQNVPGCHFAITSNDAFHLETLPDSIAIIGGSYIAVEFACIFNGLGVETLLLYRGEQILRGFDDDLRNTLAEELRKKGIDVRTHANVSEIRTAGNLFEMALPADETVRASLVMYATGRVPNTFGLGLETAGVRLDGRGAVVVDRFSCTNVGNIYAVGDVTNRLNLTPVAIREGTAFSETVFNDNPTAVDHADVPTAVFSQPEIGTVGLTEAEAREAYSAVQIYKSRFRPMKHTLTGRDETMLMKLVVEEKSDRVLGCHILGAGASEMIQLVGVALKMGATKHDFDATIAVHPTAAEELVTLG